MLETRAEDLAWEKGRWYVKGDPDKGAMIEEIAQRAYSGEPMPEGMEGDAKVVEGALCVLELLEGVRRVLEVVKNRALML